MHVDNAWVCTDVGTAWAAAFSGTPETQMAALDRLSGVVFRCSEDGTNTDNFSRIPQTCPELPSLKRKRR
jgi:hypothetical protein